MFGKDKKKKDLLCHFESVKTETRVHIDQKLLLSGVLYLKKKKNTKTDCKFQMFWQQILQLGNALVDSVTSLLFDQTVG